MTLKLIFLDSFESEFKGKKYTLFRFLDLNSLNVINGIDLKGDFKQYNIYNCNLEWNHNKLRVVHATSTN